MSKAAYIEFAKHNQDQIPIFYQPWWIESVCEGSRWDAAIVHGKNGDVLGVWPYVLFKKMSLKFLILPLLTPHLGPYLFYPKGQTKEDKRLSFEKKVISQLIDQLPSGVHIIKIKSSPSLSNWQPLYWKGFKQTTHYTYQLSLADFSTSAYTSSLRSDIKKVPEDITIEKSNDIALLYHLSKASFIKQKTTIPYSEAYLKRLDHHLEQMDQREILIARRKDGVAIGGILVIYSNQTAYLPIIGRGPMTKSESGVTKKLIHQSIINAKDRGMEIYDFEGSMFPQFEKVFRSYGSTQTPYNVLSRTKNPLLKLYFHI